MAYICSDWALLLQSCCCVFQSSGLLESPSQRHCYGHTELATWLFRVAGLPSGGRTPDALPHRWCCFVTELLHLARVGNLHGHSHWHTRVQQPRQAVTAVSCALTCSYPCQAQSVQAQVPAKTGELNKAARRHTHTCTNTAHTCAHAHATATKQYF
jgi:hypothetical protein